MLLASLDEKQLYGVQIVIYILEFVSLELLMLPFQLSEKWPSINRINIIYWILAAVVFFCMCYLDKKMPERRLRNSNKWIQGIEAAVGFLWVIFPIASKERMNIFQGMSIGESIAIGLEIIIGFIIVVGVAIIQSKMRKEEWEEENNSKKSDCATSLCHSFPKPSRRDVVQSGFRFELLQCIITYITINITDRREGYL